MGSCRVLSRPGLERALLELLGFTPSPLELDRHFPATTGGTRGTVGPCGGGGGVVGGIAVAKFHELAAVYLELTSEADEIRQVGDRQRAD